MDYQHLGKQILELVGGKDNVNSLTHCATRLRFDLFDKSIVDSDAITKLTGVISVVDSGGQFQVVIGNEVQQVYQAISQHLSNKDRGTLKAKKKEGIFSYIISIISTSFTPVIPALTGAGMIKALLAICKLMGVLSPDSHTYYLLDMLADAAFFFMPILLAYGAASKFACNPILAMTIAGALLHPNLGKLMALSQDVTFIGIPVKLADYAGSVLPIIITVWAMSYIEKFAEKFTPSMVKFFIKPMLILLIAGPLALVVIGPFGILLNDLVAQGAGYINRKASWLIPMLMGGLQPFLIITGTAWAMTPIATGQLNRNGSEMINGPGMLASNIAQGAATLCVAIKTKNKNLKQLGYSSGFTALLGITEPSLYGVTLKLKRPLIASMIGGGVAGIYAGMSGLLRYAFVSPGLAGLPAFIGDNPMNIVHALVTCFIALVVTFILTWFMGFDDPLDENDSATTIDAGENLPSSNSPVALDFSGVTLSSPLTGKVIPLSEVKDDVFSQNLIGDGIAIEPSQGKVVAPISGEVISLLESKHAIGIKSDQGIEILIHVGLDTVKLGGQFFTNKVVQGQRINVGDELIEFDLEAIDKAGYMSTTPVIILHSDSYIVENLKKTMVTIGEDLLIVKKSNQGNNHDL
ncbi:PTS system beta-glucoside-specific IIA component, Glc family (TC 4.A.1.2.5)/PTS system beta-glucoside-specific IIB component, Glc family (TC 4.A.1.2.5)/PTS system beta-glucoside-specific IIC component, Glc family (TC 4.A.1.2.5) [Gilliamella bombicola]|uniref:PTS system, beta-glucosides-specific IIC component n=1 Tax=Gilliamella bombicola TaxID=1798182 RepID=A0A1C4BI57_9GAMM|nr:beta-glucoside-specific PTS transporter subunit IIABC [Gilliamella bombicola]SCC06408.1 PTS system beta-glucoside-specific IIA component, Glc family (TC 4.A.1.2.5)/PTS system beta-glucoside-specific IIB component, Glc family (TC 4.A.1.2.5)/PTS system beta-glucoside-specific IIC component, Glc family (TC 4.A.1.2.5) [Gilliamella bombicola]